MERIKHGNVLMTIEDENKQEALELAKRFANIGYGIYATKGTADLFEAEGLYVHRASKIETEDGKNVLDIIRNGRVNFVINTVSNKKNISADGFLIRRVSAENNSFLYDKFRYSECISESLRAIELLNGFYE